MLPLILAGVIVSLLIAKAGGGEAARGSDVDRQRAAYDKLLAEARDLATIMTEASVWDALRRKYPTIPDATLSRVMVDLRKKGAS